MKTSVALLFVVLIGLAAFLMGRGKTASSAGQTASQTVEQAPPSQPRPPRRGITDPRVKVKPRIGEDVLTPEKATLLTSDERIALLKKAALLSDSEKQADILCGLISVMSQDELVETTKTLLEAQRHGNSWSQEVWNTLWTQWGRVNAEDCLALSKTGKRYPGWNGLNGLNTSNDYRCLMAGWLEAHPEAAMAWAREPKDNYREATGAAFAITSNANGDLKQMEADILAISANKLTAQACFRDYFDLATTVEGDKQTPATVYDRLNPALQAAAWPQVLERLAYSDPVEAGTWLKQHKSDPGYDDAATYNMALESAYKDPAGTAKWASELPVTMSDPASGRSHPAAQAVAIWLQQDREAANAWLATQPADAPWVKPFKHEP